MKKFLLCAILAITSFGVYASETSVDTSGLSDSEIAEIKSIAASKIAETEKAKALDKGTVLLPKDPGALATVAATWGQQAATAAGGFAHALAIAAKELGITINEFLDTPAGKLTAALIIWKVAGPALIHVLYGIFFVSAGLTLVRAMYLRLFSKEFVKVEYSSWGGLFTGTKMVRIPKGIDELHSEGQWMTFWVLVFATIATLAIGGIIIA